MSNQGYVITVDRPLNDDFRALVEEIEKRRVRVLLLYPKTTVYVKCISSEQNLRVLRLIIEANLEQDFNTGIYGSVMIVCRYTGKVLHISMENSKGW